MREGLGGLNRDGRAPEQGDILPCSSSQKTNIRSVSEQYRPQFDSEITPIRLVMGYNRPFEPEQLNQFNNTEYTISAQSDRMGQD